MKKDIRLYSKKEKKGNCILFIIGLIIFVVFMFPLYWMLTTSLKTQVQIFNVPTPLFPKSFYINAYLKQFTGEYSGTMTGFINSAIIAIGATILSTVLSIPASYSIARFRFKGKKVIIMIFLVTQMLPATLVLTSLYILFAKVNLLNNYLAPIISDSTIGIPFSILILRTYFISIPKELDEAAKIDGCNHFSAFLKVMLPIARPGVVVAIVFSFMFAWGDLIYGMTLMTDPKLRPITSSIYNYIQQYQTLWNFVMAFGIIAILPVVLIFAFMQRYIISGLTNGAIKA